MHELLIHRLDPDLPLPRTEYPGDAGLDLRARADVQIEPGQRLRIPTGIAIGMATKFGFTLLNAPGTIDAGFRGEISVIGHNTDPITVISISRGDRIAQLVIQEIPEIRIVEVEQLPGSVRSEQGFGSSG